MSRKWDFIAFSCSNYRDRVAFYSKYISVNQDRYCDSDCTAKNCPLHKPMEASQ